MKQAALIVLSFLISTACFCAPIKERDQWFARSLISELPTELVRGIAETPGKVIWLGTWGGGLCSYDGMRVKHYSSEDGLPTLHIRKCEADALGRVWMATPIGLVCRELSLFELFDSDDGLNSDNLYCLHIDSQQRVWTAGEAGGLTVIDAGRIHSVWVDQALDDWKITALILDENEGILWTGWNNGLIRALDSKTLERRPQIKDFYAPDSNAIQDLTIDSGGTVWATCGIAVLKCENHDWRKLEGLESLGTPGFTAVHSAPNGGVWIGAERGLVHFWGNGWSFFERRDGLCDDSIKEVFVDSEGSVWVGTSGGASWLLRSPFQNILPPPFPRARYMTTLIDSRGRLWAGGSILAYRTNHFWRPVDDMATEPGPEVRSLLETQDGRILAAWSHRGVLEWSEGKTRWLPEVGNLGHRYYDLAQTLDGQVLLATEKDGVFAWDGELWRCMIEPADIDTTPLFSLLCHSDGSVWLAGVGRLYRWFDNEIEEIHGPFTGTEIEIPDLLEDTSGIVWVATEGMGIFQQGGENWIAHVKGKGTTLPTNRFTSLHLDKKGHVWAGAENQGFARLQQGGWFIYTVESGLPACRIAGIATDDSGSTFLATYEFGILEYRPDDRPPETSIDSLPEFLVEGERGVVELSFSDPWKRTLARHGRFSWRLDDGRWSPPTASPIIRLPGLRVGRHRIEARAFDGDGNVDPTASTAELEVAYPWWKHPVTAGLVTLLLIQAAVVIILLRRRFYALSQDLRDTHDYQAQLEKEVAVRTRALKNSEQKYREIAEELDESNRSKERLISNLSHDFRTPLTSLTGSAEILASCSPGSLNPAQMEFIEIILNNAGRMGLLVENVAQAVQENGKEQSYARGPLNLMEVTWRSIRSHTVRARHLEIGLELVTEGEDFWVSGVEALVERLLDNLLSNAIKYSESGGNVVVRLTKVEDSVVLSVQDEGVGIPAEEIPRIFDRFYQSDASQKVHAGGLGLGLSICQEIAEIHDAYIEVESTPGQGTTFRVTWPESSP